MADPAILYAMGVISVRVEKSGRILIPSAIRRSLGLIDGESDLLLHIDETPVRVTTRAQAVAEAQRVLATYGPPTELWSEALIAEREQEARKE